MKYVKIALEDAVLAVLAAEARKLGLKMNAYIQLTLGRHAAEAKERKETV